MRLTLDGTNGLLIPCSFEDAFQLCNFKCHDNCGIWIGKDTEGNRRKPKTEQSPSRVPNLGRLECGTETTSTSGYSHARFLLTRWPPSDNCRAQISCRDPLVALTSLCALPDPAVVPQMHHSTPRKQPPIYDTALWPTSGSRGTAIYTRVTQWGPDGSQRDKMRY